MIQYCLRKVSLTGLTAAIMTVAMMLIPGSAPAQTNMLKATSTRVYAPNKMVKKIHMAITVRNTGKVDASGTLYVTLSPDKTLRPRTASDDPPVGKTLWDPYELNQTIENLKPGESKVYDLETPYFSPEAFDQSGSTYFEATNPAANNMQGDIRVNFKIRIDE